MKQTVLKKVLSLFLVAMLVIGFMPVSAFAEDVDDNAASQTEDVVLPEESVSGDSSGSSAGEESGTQTGGSAEESPALDSGAAGEAGEGSDSEAAGETVESAEDETAVGNEAGETEADQAADTEAVSADGAVEDSSYYKVISRKYYSVSPGVTEIDSVINDETASNQNKTYILDINLSNPNVTVMPSYRNMDPTVWGTQVMSEQAAAAERLGYNVVGAINVNLSWDTVEPLGMLVINGEKYHEDTSYGGAYLVIHEDNTAEIRPGTQPLDGSEYQAISVNFGWLVKDGKSLYPTEDHSSANRAPRTCIGIKADGSLVLFVCDGRQNPVAVGMTAHEMAEALLEAGCVDAVNCDGGGSSTFITEREGSGVLSIKNVPSDGTERATLGGLLVISTIQGDGSFDHASVTAPNDYYTPGSEVQFSASGVDNSGAAVALPEEGLTWALADDSMGTIDENGVFTSNGTLGDVTVQLLLDGEVCGSGTISILEPDSMFFFETSRSLALNASADLEMQLQGNGKTIKYKGADFTWKVELISANDASVTDPAQIGWIEDGTTTFVSNPFLSGDVLVTAIYTRQDGTELTAQTMISVGKLPSVFWDYEDGEQIIEVWEQVEKVDETTGETSTVWQIKTDEDGNIVYETKYFDAEDFYNALMIADANSPTIEEQMASHFGLRSDRNAKGHTEIVDLDSGEPVRFGDKSLKLCYDFTASTGSPSVLGYGYMQNTNYAPGSPTGIGMWIYVPEGTPGYSMKSIVQSAGKAVYLTYQYTYTNEDGETVTTTSLEDMAGRGWIYVSASLVGKGDGTFKMLRNYTIRLIAENFTVHPDRYASGCIYIDNIEFIYGYDNKDTVNPSVTSVYNYNTDEEIARDGTTELTGNILSFAAKFSDDDGEYATGMDLDAVRVYIDGVNMSSTEGFIVTKDNLLVLPNVRLANGLHSIRVRIRDNYGNETNETRFFTVNGPETPDTIVSFGPADTASAPYLESEYVMALTAVNGGNVNSVSMDAKFNIDFGEPTVSYAEGFSGSYTYNAKTGEFSLNVTRTDGSEAAPEQLATLAFAVPGTLTPGSSFAYSVSSGVFTTATESSYTNSFSYPTTYIPVKAHYTLTVEGAVVGYPFEISITDEDGEPVSGAKVFVDGTVQAELTDENGKLTLTISEAGTLTMYASTSDENGALTGRSWNVSVVVHSVAGDGTANPYFVQNNATGNSYSGKNITWMSSISAAEDAAVLRLYTEDPSTTENAAWTEYTGSTENVHFAAESARVCTVELTGLNAGTTYYYTVGDGETWSEVYHFTTAGGTSTNFFIIGDTQTTNTANVEAILDMVAASGVPYSFAIQTGDAVDDSSAYAYWDALSKVFDAAGMNGVDLIHVLGNHEFYGDVNGIIPQAIYNLPASGSASHYSVEYGDVYVAVINYATDGNYDEAFAWLVSNAKESDCKWKILTMHVPTYGTNAEAVNDNVRNNLPAAAQEAGIDFVFSGHDHSYARTEPMVNGAVDENGVVYFICGSTGEKSYNVTVNPDYNFALVNDSYGALYMSVETTENAITITARDVNGTVIDTYTKEYVPCADGNHKYVCDTAEGTVACRICGDLPTGIIEVDGKLYYAIDGKLYSGWRSAIDGTDIYYFDPVTYAAATGVYTIEGNEYTFDDNGILVRGAFVKESGGTRYYFGGRYLIQRWITLEEGTYWADNNGYIAYGYFPHQEYNHADYYWYHFDETTGLLDGKCSGFVEYKGETYYCDENGKALYGAVQVENGIIFSGTMGKVVKNGKCYISDDLETKAGLENGPYWCDENGYVVSDGFVTIDGSTYYFSNYIRAKGFTKVGEDYYFFNAGSGKMYTSITLWVGDNEYGIPAGYYDFQADGTMYVPDANGAKEIIEENGNLYFTIDGMKQKNGLNELDGEYYYAQTNGVLVRNATIWVSQKNGLIPEKGYWHAFDADGKLVQTGFVNGGDGYTYYYKDNVLALGFTKVGEDYYFFNAGSGKMYTSTTLWVGDNAYGIPGGYYDFQADGTMYIPDANGTRKVVEENGNLYFTIDGVKQKNGLNELDGEYYYAQTNGVLVRNATIWVSQKNGLIPEKGYWHAFDGDGKLVQTGFVNGGDGYTYYYKDNVLALGFTKVGEDYYFFNAGSGKMYTSTTLWVGDNAYGILAGYYDFQADGTMYVPDANGAKEIIEENGNLYFTIDGMKQKNGLNELDGEYYYAQTNGVLVRNATVWVSQKNGLIPEKGDWHAFDADGKLVQTGFVNGGDGYTYYYKDNVLALGFTKVGEDYYFFNAGSGKMYTSTTLWVGDNAYGIPAGYYDFQADGTMYVPDANGAKEIIEENGNLYFTIDGVKQKNGLNELDGEYYYAQTNGVLVKNATVWVSQKNGLIPEKGDWHAFDADGKLVQTGFVNGGDGYTYYYKDNVLALGFTKVGEDYYFFNAGSGKMYTSITLWVGDNEYGIPGGYYDFQADGTMANP